MIFCRKLGADPEKSLRRRLKCFFFCIIIPAKIGAIYDRTFYVCFFSSISDSLDGGTLKSRWGTLNLNGGTLNLDASPPVPPYNLSTGYSSFNYPKSLTEQNPSLTTYHSVQCRDVEAIKFLMLPLPAPLKLLRF